MSNLKPDTLRKQLSAGNLARCYLFHGQERYLQASYVQSLRKAVLGAEDDPFNLRQLEGKDLDLRTLRDALDAYPSFAERALVEVRDFDLFQSGEEYQKQLSALLDDLPDYCCLLFLYDTLEYKPDKRKKKLYQAIDSAVTVVEFPVQGQSELVRWIQKHFQARQKRISSEDAAYLIFLCGSLMDALVNEIGKIAVYAQGDTVTRADIDQVAVPVVEAETFRLADALSARDYEKAAELMYKLFQLNTEPIVINALIGSQLRRLYAASLVKASGGGPAQLGEVLNATSDYMPRQYLRICGSFSEQWYREMIRRSAETDYRMKNAGTEPEDLLRTLFLAMAAPCV